MYYLWKKQANDHQTNNARFLRWLHEKYQNIFFIDEEEEGDNKLEEQTTIDDDDNNGDVKDKNNQNNITRYTFRKYFYP